MKTKILVCGSTGFLMSNFIRYILYWSNDFSVVSLDSLASLKDTKRLYFNKNNNFYIGKPSDKYLLERIIYIEKPDVIICGDEIYEYLELLETLITLISFNLPLIVVSPAKIKDDLFVSIKNIISENNHTLVELPNRFGMRQRSTGPGGNVARLIKNYLFDKNVVISDVSVPWVYAEDVAAFLWNTIENQYKGLVSMPPLGIMSEKDIAKKIESLYKIGYDIIVDNSLENRLVKEYKYQDFKEWDPDSKNIEEVLEKTIKWFDANRWAFNE
jgi:hypothetical protein